ncbi:aldose epimerase family protein [Sphingomonas sp. RB3P16]|uniref:aldose epimerase family protein n=1 Tax=Parasphingomonas frigoris TaxID=3096163 RepID=UPI002FC74F17
MSVDRTLFGRLRDGAPVEAICLTAGPLSATILTYGATLQALHAPDRDGRIEDITLGHDTLDPYVDQANFFGVTVGRYANRIGGGAFRLDGIRYALDRNEGAQCLHGGYRGFDTQLWSIVEIEDGERPAVVLACSSADGHGGFPGRLDVRVRYMLDGGSGTLLIDFTAATTAPTVVNLTNHAVFNLAGADSAETIQAHTLAIHASRYTPVNADMVPTGEIRSVDGSVLDFRAPRALIDDADVLTRFRDGHAQLALTNGYNHNFVLDRGRGAIAAVAARLEHAASGRVLEVLTTEPGLQLYCSNHLDGDLVGKHGRRYHRAQGVALEPQAFPDSPNQPHFPSTRIDPGVPYRHTMAYRLPPCRKASL